MGRSHKSRAHPRRPKSLCAVAPPQKHSSISNLSHIWEFACGLDIFKAITLPNLRAFEVRNTGQWLHEDFEAFLARSQCRLESLLFSGGVVTTDGQLAEYVALFPSLELSTNTMRSGIFI
ncbi:hypothetical protein BDR06DRAFT_964559 [Suillus hirtellus]|nr:hypothetical protein BDR06DRAFT_964559 [Suillus hirtellus]